MGKFKNQFIKAARSTPLVLLKCISYPFEVRVEQVPFGVEKVTTLVPYIFESNPWDGET